MKFMTKIKNMQKVKILALIAPLLGGVGGGMLSSCTDWNDHYTTDSSMTESQGNSIMTNIEQTPNLSQFASLLKKTGFDQRLNASQTYTVWAPVNDSFDYNQLDAMSNSRLLKQFIQNHVARNNYPATGTMNQKVYMLNEKLMHFEGVPENYSIQGIALDGASQNIGSNNGTLHTIGAKIPYLANIYESLNAEEFPLDSISNYFHAYDSRKLDEQRSVPGPIVDGEQTYLDSIFYEDNSLYRSYRAYINAEDSNYTMILPTNTAWEKARKRIAQYYNYVPKFSVVNATALNNDTTIVVNLRDAAQLKDSITKDMLMADLVFNNNIYDNRKLPSLKEGETPKSDSIVSTSRNILYADDVKGLFADAKRVDKSNGAIWVTDSLNYPAWAAWNPEITVEAEHWVYKTVYAGTSGTVRISNNQNLNIKGHVSNDAFYAVTPNSPGDHPEMYFHIPDVRSTEYNVYIVLLPNNIINDQLTYKPNSVSVGVRYSREDGTLINESTLRGPDGTTFSTNDSIAQVDTLFLGSVTFPIAYYGTGDSYPYIRVRSRFSSSGNNKYSRNLLVDCLILRPKELDDYLATHPGYKYDKHNR